MGYVTLQEYKDYMASMNALASQSVPNQMNDTFLSGLIETATTTIESETKRKFQAYTATRSYDARSIVWNDRQLLLVDEDLISVSAIVNGDGSSISPSDVFLENLNIIPHYGIRLKTNKVWSFQTDGRISVTGSWGFSAVPAGDVKNITCRLAYIIMMKRNSTGDVEVVGSGDGVGGTLRYGSYIPGDVREWLKRHTRHHYVV